MTIKFKGKFIPKTWPEEVKMVLTDDPRLTNTRVYLGRLINNALDRFELSPIEIEHLETQLHTDLTLAASRYLEHKRYLDGTKFSTYFSWYIMRRLHAKNIVGLRRKRSKL